MKNNTNHLILRGDISYQWKQKGVVLWVTLMVLVVLLGATLVIARNTTIGQSIAGNIGFKKNATQVADYGVEKARAWLSERLDDEKKTPVRTKQYLEKDHIDFAYWASWGTFSDDPKDFAWDVAKEVFVDGQEVKYVIHRMCRLPGKTTPAAQSNTGTKVKQECVFVPGEDCADCSIGSQASKLPFDVKRPFYRVTSRVRGPRNTVSYVQTMLY